MATTLNVRVNGLLEEFIADNIGKNGVYDNASEYVRHLIRQDKERADAARFEILKAEVRRALSAPDSDYVEVDRDELLARIKRQRG
ncbi:type II toxin-antitoxin system ParD family antitoxin [Sphingomonas sp. MMS12-HWE2-04]|uniref:ribbon-helix-helix domain-containing protein n=1 Tax=Sphingomonas sp. MMS12-HWE2-04 TaxID=3234199 RepID=UPI00384EA42B